MLIGILPVLLLLSLSPTQTLGAAVFSPNFNDKQIMDRLVHSQRYDKRIKPPVNPLQVNISVVLLSLSSPDESSLTYEVEFLMHQKWEDSRNLSYF